jgi:phospholipase/carboxylesterase
MNATAKGGYLKESEPLLHYLVRAPKTAGSKPPLIILLHGIGTDEHDLFSLAEQLPGNFLVISARGPYTISAGSYAWYQADFSKGNPIINKEQAEKSRNVIIQFIGQLKEKHDFDENQVYLCGFSQGAIMAYSVGLTRPDKIKGIAALSGRILDEVKPMITSDNKLQHLQVFIGHGTTDKVLDIHYAHDAYALLKQKGIKPTYKEYNEGHGINNEELADLKEWLATQLKH